MMQNVVNSLSSWYIFLLVAADSIRLESIHEQNKGSFKQDDMCHSASNLIPAPIFSPPLGKARGAKVSYNAKGQSKGAVGRFHRRTVSVCRQYSVRNPVDTSGQSIKMEVHGPGQPSCGD